MFSPGVPGSQLPEPAWGSHLLPTLQLHELGAGLSGLWLSLTCVPYLLPTRKPHLKAPYSLVLPLDASGVEMLGRQLTQALCSAPAKSTG